jgi:hypothetical protein
VVTRVHGRQEAAPAAAVAATARPRPRRTDSAGTVALALLALMLVYACCSLLDNPRGTLGTDTGGKLATLAEMDRAHSLDPDVGYWAEDHDPEGRLHPLWYTSHVGERWVNVTTLPMVLAASPLYDVGGPRAVLLLPMLGAAFSALAARALSRRIAGSDGWWAFWVVGLASPIAIYALDFWEHAPGVAFMMWGIVFMYDLMDGRAGWRGAMAAGALFGAAATMRTEALVYAAITVGVAAVVLVHRTVVRRELTWIRNVQYGLAWLGGIGAVLAANQVFERVVLGTAIRAERAAGTAGMAGAARSLRVQEAMTTALGVNRFDQHTSWLVGGLAVAFVAYAAWKFAAPRHADLRAGGIAIAFACVLYFVCITAGLDFVPGFLSASPLAAAGIAVGWSVRRWRVVGAVALVALPVVWAFQFSGGAGPQWGGRYLLVTSTLLVIGAAVVLPAMPKVGRVALVALAALVTASGLAFLSQRSHTVADAMTAIQTHDGTVLVSRETHVLREGGAFYDTDERWLTATTARDLELASEIAADVNAPAMRVVSFDGRPIPNSIGAWQRSQRRRVEFVPGLFVNVVTYARAAAG